jgi:hypothetical protein
VGCLQEALLGDSKLKDPKAIVLQTDKVKDVRLIVEEADIVDKLKQLKRGNCGIFKVRLIGDLEKGLRLKCISFEPMEKGSEVPENFKKETREFEMVRSTISDRKSGKHSDEETKH